MIEITAMNALVYKTDTVLSIAYTLSLFHQVIGYLGRHS